MANRNDFNSWRRANELRKCVVTALQKLGKGFTGDWQDHPIFQLCGEPLVKLGFSIYEIPKTVWKQWEQSEDNYESEITIIIANPKTPKECVSEIHYHNGDVLITALGKSFGFKEPEGALLRGLFNWEITLSDDCKVSLEHYQFEDNRVYPIQSLEPHGTFVELHTVTAFLAVTCGQRFNIDGELVGTDNIALERCTVCDKDMGEELRLESYIPYEKS